MLALRLALVLVLAQGCGVGDELLLGQYADNGHHHADASALDGGLDDAGARDAHVPDASHPDSGHTPHDAGPAPECVVPVKRSAARCSGKAPADAYAPRVKWRFPPASLTLDQSVAPGTPLVANLTDDNGDQRIDLCDVPDVVVVAGTSDRGAALWILAGDTGHVENLVAEPLLPGVAPAIGDLDADGTPEIVAIDENHRIFALHPDGSVRWRGGVVTTVPNVNAPCYAVSLYDLEGDGSPEILAGFSVFDATGNQRFGADLSLVTLFAANLTGCIAPIAADLDDDGQLEVLFGHQTLHANGKTAWVHQLGQSTSIPAVGNLDGDAALEVVLTTEQALYVLDGNGTALASLANAGCGGHALSIHDFDGDGHDELAVPTCTAPTQGVTVYTLSGKTLKPSWTAGNAFGSSTWSGAAAFDLLGSGHANLVFSDEQGAGLYAGADGSVIVEGLRSTGSAIVSPVIADVDNDGSAEILLPTYETGEAPSLTVIGDEKRRWVGARRIWNQHAYHVTNVHEDARIPKGPTDAPHYPTRMRSNAQLEHGTFCVP